MTEYKFVDAYFAAAKSKRTDQEIPAQYTRPLIAAARQQCPPVFSHGDLHAGNIMIRYDGTLVIIDWERAGWYPPFWERAIEIMSRTNEGMGPDWRYPGRALWRLRLLICGAVRGVDSGLDTQRPQGS